VTQPPVSLRCGRPRGYGRFYLRSFVSLMMVGSLLTFTASGLALFVSPSGQLANVTGWTLLGLGKGQWEALHIAFGFLWMPLAVLHLVFNLRVVGGYLRDRVRRAFVGRRELWAAAIVTAFLAVASVLALPPVAQLMAWGDSFNGYWAARSPNVVATTSQGGPDAAAHGTGMGRYAVANEGGLAPVGKQASARLETHDEAPPVGTPDEP
jgi:hypothetical protein